MVDVPEVWIYGPEYKMMYLSMEELPDSDYEYMYWSPGWFMCKILSILYIYMHQSKYVWKRYLILIMNICTGVLDGLCVKFCPFCTFICTRANMSFQNEALNVHQHSGCLHLNTIVHTQM